MGWLRAAVLGANDGIISTACLMLGVLASGATQQTTLITGLAGLIAGAMSMAAGEYISVQSQADIESADLAKEAAELLANPVHELEELTAIYCKRGLNQSTALAVAEQLTAHNALEAHARDELGITELSQANPVQAALSSGISFTLGALLPIVSTLITHSHLYLILMTLFYLAVLGVLAAYSGSGLNYSIMKKSALRVTLWGGFAMGVSIGIGELLQMLSQTNLYA
jgi:VIT1/CCC1 family predicted Fe2+/Mn2+ transporter